MASKAAQQQPSDLPPYIDAGISLFRELVLGAIRSAKDRLTMARWASTLGAASLGLIPVKGEDLLQAGGSPAALVLATCLVLLGSSLVGAVYHFTHRLIDLEWERIGLITFQGLRLKVNPSLLPDAQGDLKIEVFQRIWRGGILATSKAETMQDLERKSQRLTKRVRRLLRLQVTVTALGYVVFIGSSLYSLVGS